MHLGELCSCSKVSIRDHSGYGLGQWEKALHSNASPLWLSPYPEWFLSMIFAVIFSHMTMRNTQIPGVTSSSRAGGLGRTLWPQNSTSVAETEKGGQNSTMTPHNARKGGSIFYISMKSRQKRGSKIYNSKKYRGQNSTSLKMGVKILHAEK